MEEKNQLIVLAPLKKRKKIAENTYEVSFKLPHVFVFKSGQYARITLPSLLAPDPRGNQRDFSIASSPNSRSLSIAVRDTKSGFKKTLLEGENVQAEIQGPFGLFTLPEDASHHLIFIAGGIGVTPFLSMIRFVMEEKLPYTITLLYVNKSQDSAAYLKELRKLDGENENFLLKEHVGHLTKDVIKEKVERSEDSLFYLAGTPQMVNDTKDMLLELGIELKNITMEEFSGYLKDVEPQAATVLSKESSHVKPAKKDKKLGAGIEGELARRSLSDLEALLQALNNTAIVSETNAAGTITFVNDKFIEISKYSRQELIGQNHRILKSSFHSKAFYENLWATITRGRLWRGQIKNKAKDGSYYWVDTSIAPILERGEPIKYISVRFPITERQQAEEQLQERAKQQSVLTILSQEALANPDMTSLFDNACRLLAQTLGVEYCAVLKLLPGGIQLVYDAGVGFNAEKGKTIVSAESQESMAGYTLASKEPVIIEDLSNEARFSGSDLLHDHNIMSGISVIIHGQEHPYGILEVHTMQKRIFTAEDINFIQAVANLLANAARNQLDKRKDEFLGIASHELKTPLTSIKTFIQLLHKHSRRQNDEHSLLFLSRINTQVNKMAELINDLLDISRINSGKLEYHDNLFSLSELVEDIIREQQLTTQRHKIIFEDKVKQQIYADKFRIGQVLINLLSNAIKYAPDADKIIVRTEKQGDKITLSVHDFGIGIPKKEQQHIFDRFYQGDIKKREDFPGGLGLGLYISSEIVKRHKGQIWVESEEGKGSIFYVSLPIKV